MGDLNTAKVTVDTRYGFIKAELQRKDGEIQISFEVPEGTTAYVVEGRKRTPFKSGKHEMVIKE
jgi:hypothetical protein